MGNLLLGLFNLLPAYPMDGGRILRSLIALRKPEDEATRIAARAGSFATLLPTSCPSLDKRKSINSLAAAGCGALTAMPSGFSETITGSTATQSIGPPFFLIESALPL